VQVLLLLVLLLLVLLLLLLVVVPLVRLVLQWRPACLCQRRLWLVQAPA
jgi:hypothetical protein